MRSAPPTKLQLNVRSDGSGITGFCFAIHLEPVACLFVPPKRYVKRRICTLPRRSADCSSHLGQRQLAPELLQMRLDDCPSEGLRPLWRVEPDLERDRDSRQHATQYEYLDHRDCP